MDAVRTALAARPGVRATFVLDYNRATRPGKGTPASTVDMLMPLLERFGDRVDVWLYRTPKLRGLLEAIVPPRFNEGWGTWHAKYYAVDDDVMLSGANLAASYFTNRQDRYIHLASHPSLLSYLSSITRLVSDYSYKVVPHARPGALGEHGVLLRPGSAPIPVGKRGASTASGPGALWRERSLPPRGWSGHANATFGAFQQAWRASNGVRTRDAAAKGADTWFWPVLQAGVLSIGEEERAMAAVWAAIRRAHDAGEKVEVDLTSGYFGLYDAYKRAVVNSPAPVRVIAASPKVSYLFRSSADTRRTASTGQRASRASSPKDTHSSRAGSTPTRPSTGASGPAAYASRSGSGRGGRTTPRGCGCRRLRRARLPRRRSSTPS